MLSARGVKGTPGGCGVAKAKAVSVRRAGTCVSNSCQICFKWGEKGKAWLCKQKATISLNTLDFVKDTETFSSAFVCIAGTKMDLKQQRAMLSISAPQSKSTPSSHLTHHPPSGGTARQLRKEACICDILQHTKGNSNFCPEEGQGLAAFFTGSNAQKEKDDLLQETG